MYRLYGFPGSASMAPRAVLEEIGVPFEWVTVDISEGPSRDPVYLALNPHGRVPTLAHDGGAIYEAAAICLFLAERHAEAGLAPAVGAPERALFLQWMIYLSDTVQETYYEGIHPDRYSDEPADALRIEAKAWQTIDFQLGVLDRALDPGPYLLGEHYSVADTFLAMLAFWHMLLARAGGASSH